ncbi:hypothetical protein [Pseudomonas oryzae]|uniref:Uncharacterized protein n=1 Tax=Pseudomonas oryzae TaxID=1392877 RepID=A0A1H1M2L2_9PSED|nr:hypothetical protein [Pseudomonas oryzae]SDR81001.1 hypothetical protein SAMN05216221_0384 [Pseudomonas oryzae]
MRSQATRVSPQREEQVEIIGCILSLLLCLGILLALHHIPWSIFG